MIRFIPLEQLVDSLCAHIEIFEPKLTEKGTCASPDLHRPGFKTTKSNFKLFFPESFMHLLLAYQLKIEN